MKNILPMSRNYAVVIVYYAAVFVKTGCWCETGVCGIAEIVEGASWLTVGTKEAGSMAVLNLADRC